jgi:hypothetical protein
LQQPSSCGCGRDLDDAFDLDRNRHRQRAHADRRARVPPGVAEHFDEQVRAAVDDARVVGELGVPFTIPSSFTRA